MRLRDELELLAGSPLFVRLRALRPSVLARELPLLAGIGGDFEASEESALDGIVGTLDLLYRDPAAGEVVVADFKTDEIPADRAAAAIADKVARYGPQLEHYGRAVQSAMALDRPPRLSSGCWRRTPSEFWTEGTPARVDRRRREPVACPGKRGSALTVTYSSYLHLDELLAAQQPLSDGPEHDEMLFIVIHQVYELWFKQLLHEVDYLGAALDAGDLPRARNPQAHATILKVLVAQIDILETMTPVSFLSFRERLEPPPASSRTSSASSSSCSAQAARACSRYHAGSAARDAAAAARLERRALGRFLRFLVRRGYAVPAELLDARPVAAPIATSPELQDVLVDIYRTRPDRGASANGCRPRRGACRSGATAT